MAQALSLRASSLGFSALLVGAAVVGALTMKYAVHLEPVIGEPPPIVTFAPAPEPAPPPPAPSPPRSHPITAPGLLPLALDRNLPATPYSGPEPAPAAPVTITDPRWAREPRDLERFYPARALQRGVEGEVVLQCDVSERGVLNCVVVSETPVSWGFGPAALRISREYTMVPATANGVPAPGRYRMVVPFDIR